jgi:anti-anti-sigma factor
MAGLVGAHRARMRTGTTSWLNSYSSRISITLLPIALLMQAREKTHTHPGHSLFVTTVHRGGVLTIKPAGPNLTEREAIIITSEVTPYFEQLGKKLRGVVLDLSDVKMMSSFGLGLCLEFRNSGLQVGASTILVGLSKELRDLFKMMKVDRLYTIADAKHVHSAMAA